MKLLAYQPHKKIGYSAGMISLALLPILCLCWLYKYELSNTKYIIDIAFWNPNNKEIFSQDYWPESLIKKKNTIINLTGNNHDDMIRLEHAQVLLSRWKADKDDTQVLNFHFGNKAKYWTFIEAINVCKAVKLNSYLPYQNNMYAFWNFHSKPFENPPMPLLFWGNDIVEIREPVDWLLEAHKLIQLLKDYWAPGIVFLLMTVLTLKKLYNRSKSFNVAG